MGEAALNGAGMGRSPLRLETPGGNRPRLLLAEDCDPVRIVTAAMLKGMGCDVEAVIHGEQAVQSAAENSFDVIVLDIEMPIMDGITAARSIRRMGGAAAVTPLMALSAFLADSVRTGDWRDTFDIALPKPANRNELHEAVKAALNRNHAAGPGSGGHVLPPVMDAARFEALRSGITRPVWRDLSGMACRDIELCIRQLEAAHPAQKNGLLLTFTSKLAGLAVTFAAERLSWAAENVQRACSETARQEAVGLLIASARETVQALRA
jgi:CheY-like chemotaxis protein